MTTVGIDLNNQMYQFAYAIVEKKNNDAWNWFISLVVRDLNISVSSLDEWTFITNQQKGILEVIAHLLPSIENIWFKIFI